MATRDNRRNRRHSGDGSTRAIGFARPSADTSIPRDVRVVIDRLRANLHRAVPLAELAAEAGVSPRRLQEHFHRFIGEPPSVYGLRLRLNGVRRELQRLFNTDPIAEIALGYGFPHPARFGQQYRRLFGETASATRRKTIAHIASPAPRGDRPEIAILPFQAPLELSGLAGLLADSLAAALSGEAAIRRPSLNAAFRPSRDIDARYRLRGELVLSGERVRFALALIDAVADRHLWGDAWDGSAGNPLATIDRILAGAARAVPSRIRHAEMARVQSMPPEHMDAYQLCLRAYPLLAVNSVANVRRALDLLDRAVERDPDYGLAVAFAAWGRAQVLSQMGSASPAEDRAQALLLSARAGTLDPDTAMVLTARSVVHTTAEERDVAGQLVGRALARNPRLAWAWERSGWLRANAGDMSGAMACFGRSLRLDPASPAKPMHLAGIAAGLFGTGRYDLAAQWMTRAMEAEPGAVWVHRTLAVALAHIGEPQAAIRSLDALRRYRPDIRVRDVTAAMHLPADFVARVGNGLSELGLPP